MSPIPVSFAVAGAAPPSDFPSAAGSSSPKADRVCATTSRSPARVLSSVERRIVEESLTKTRTPRSASAWAASSARPGSEISRVSKNGSGLTRTPAESRARARTRAFSCASEAIRRRPSGPW